MGERGLGRIWFVKLIQVARPQFLIASLALYILGAAWGVLLGAPLDLARILLGYLIVMPAQLSVSFSNDAFDVEVDRFGKPSLFSGGSGILVEYPQLRKPALGVAIGLTASSVLFAILFLSIYSYPIWFLAFVLVSNLLGWVYSAPPLRLSYRGLGELVNACMAGFLLPGMGYWVVRGTIDWEGLLFTLPLVLYGLAFILAVEIPDVEADRLGQKMTWVARRGRSFGFTAIAALMLAATLFFFSAANLFSNPASLDFRFLGFSSLLPLGAAILGLVRRPSDRQAATRLVNVIIITLALFLILTDAYLVFSITG